ncbi:MAG TPA: epoxide hydrolase N-terminal domain-containing protein, partial [Ktedonobacterales bacterium]|nr:epoxide hydrolase N-terminal domain-containing protein [Ktedonobacterales bacterium]
MSQPSPSLRITPFTIQVEEAVLTDLRVRIHQTRWPDQLPGMGWQQGTDLHELRQLLGYWADGYDWRARERALNTFQHFRAELDGIHIHFVHARAPSGQG